MKPRIYKAKNLGINGPWFCYGHHLVVGTGSTPKQAYEKWAERLEQYQQRGPITRG